MLEYARAHAADVGEGLELLPGVEDLLKALSDHPQCLVALVSTNWKYDIEDRGNYGMIS